MTGIKLHANDYSNIFEYITDYSPEVHSLFMSLGWADDGGLKTTHMLHEARGNIVFAFTPTEHVFRSIQTNTFLERKYVPHTLLYELILLADVSHQASLELVKDLGVYQRE